MLSGAAWAQNAPLVIAFEAPDCTGSNPSDPTNCDANPHPAYFTNFMASLNANVSGIGLTIPWAKVDNCLVGSASSECGGQAANCSAEMGGTYYKWCGVDHGLMQYINQPSFAGKKIALIVSPISDSSPNQNTPPYVSTTGWAMNPRVASVPQEQAVCPSWPGDVTTSSCPLQLVRAGALEPNNFAIWNNNSQCLPNLSGNANPDLQCVTCSSADDTGFPIPYERPFQVAYEDFLTALVQHYSATTGSNMGPTIAPYIAYIRVGMAEGGENQPYCSVSGGHLPQTQWSSAPTNVPAGYIANIDNEEYVATGAGMKGSTPPTCSPAGCTTAPDNSIPGWYNAGPWSNPLSGGAIWPGPKGQFASPSQGQDYSDNGYLSIWDNLTGTPGYIASMVSFLQGLHAGFPFAISAHAGPPSETNTAYANADSVIASVSGVGFGMESTNVDDSAAYARGAFLTSEADWAHNFQAYPAPIHYLQTFFPGFPSHAAGFPINYIGPPSGGGTTPTIYCFTDCSIYSGTANGFPIYITGGSSPQFNGIVVDSACPSSGCTANQLTIPGSVPSTTYAGGTVWAPDFWPIVMPFAVRRHATVIEAYECDLDYAFGLYFAGTPTTNWGSSTGCVFSNFGTPPSPVPDSVDAGYRGTLADTLAGQPAATSVRTGNSILVNGAQY